MLKVGGRQHVNKETNKKLDKVAEHIIDILNKENVHSSFTHGSKNTWNLILCDEENRECVELKINDDDRIFRV